VPNEEEVDVTDEKKEFSIRDRRTTTSDAGTEQPNQGVTAETQQQEAETAPSLDFSTFVISVASSAQVNLGAIPHPETNQTSQNFPAAKQMIDILGILKEKTRGNLTEAESALLEQVLFQLHLHYARTLEGQKKSGG
jgi:hypothetical protein